MSDRLDAIKQFFENARVLMPDDIRYLFDKIDRLRANQIPGRCGECKHWTCIHKDMPGWGVCASLREQWPRNGYCYRFDYKEKRDE